MLTREQLQAECRKIFDALPDRGETIDGVDDAVLKLNKQAAMAIDLEAENERWRAVYDRAITNLVQADDALVDLQAKLDKVRKWADAVLTGCQELRKMHDLSEYGAGRFDAVSNILSILNEKDE
jgi:hypothetical protein